MLEYPVYLSTYLPVHYDQVQIDQTHVQDHKPLAPNYVLREVGGYIGR